jgi:hypothetical protein
MITASGGLVYHARAARSLIKCFNPDGSWNPTRRRVSSWVRDWVESHSFKTLILVGPSAAYLIDDNIWSEIQQVVVIEPDRLAKWIFKLRFPGWAGADRTRPRRMDWIHRSDLLPYFSRETDEFSMFLKNYDPQTTGVLFFGCLGQMAFHEKDYLRTEAEARSLLLEATRRFSTASLHDLYSVTVPALSASTAREIAELDLHLPESEYSPRTVQELIGRLSDQFFGQLSDLPAPLVWTDHVTYWLGRPRTICPWILTSEQIHILGFVTRS